MTMSPDSSSSRELLFQVRKAVEDAEAIISHQMEENNQLKEEKDVLQRKIQQLERYNLQTASQRSSTDALTDEHPFGSHRAPFSGSSIGNEPEKMSRSNNISSMNPEGMIVIHQNGNQGIDNFVHLNGMRNQQMIENSRPNGTSTTFTQSHAGVDVPDVTQFSPPPSRSLFPNRHRKEDEYDPMLKLSKDSLMLMSEVNSNNPLKQDLIAKVREREEEIAQLRKHVAEYSIKEAQIRNEKYMLEKRIAFMRKAFDQQQQDLVDAASKALSYRQEIVEENVRLTYQLQAAQQEKSTFVSSLLPLLSEYGLQPPVLDAQSIVSSLKVLFRHLQEKLIITEDRLKESQYQLTPWHTESSNNTSFQPQSPSHRLDAALVTSNKNNLELVPQQQYTHADWEVLTNQNRHTAPSGLAVKNMDQDAIERVSSSLSRNHFTHEASVQMNQSDHAVQFDSDSKGQHPSFKDLVRSNEVDEPEAAGLQHGREAGVRWGPANSQYVPSGHDDSNTYHHLPPVLEEPSSSFSEAAEDDPLPGIEELQIAGEAFPGRVLQACGYSINGTTTCNFEWVRYLEDGSVNYIEGAKEPSYLVTADDVDTYLAIEVQPLDKRKRKGELVKVYANDHKKIACDPKMQEQIERTLSAGHASLDLSVRTSEIWERAILSIKRDGYSLKYGPSGVAVTEKFLPTTEIVIPYGEPNYFFIHLSNGSEYLLRTTEGSWSRDAIVRTMRLFKIRAVDKRKGRKRGLFF